ncbi:septal ring lytic transglycosylase RlpA family protein [Flavobacterium sp.]
MNNKILIVFLIIATSVFGGSIVNTKPQQKDKNKDTRGKAEQGVVKSAKASTAKDKEKVVAVAKDTAIVKLTDAMPQLDSINLMDVRLKLLKKNAHASYYHNRFHGRRTASGKKFDNNAYTAAHKKLPFGTKVKVTNEANGKFVIVEITDRGPFSKAREIDLSRRAFMDIASNKNSGMVLVTLEVIEAK